MQQAEYGAFGCGQINSCLIFVLRYFDDNGFFEMLFKKMLASIDVWKKL